MLTFTVILKNCIGNQYKLGNYAYKSTFITSLEKPEGLSTRDMFCHGAINSTGVAAASSE